MESLDVSKAYFSRSKSERLLPLVEIPLKVIDLVHSGMNPHGKHADKYLFIWCRLMRAISIQPRSFLDVRRS